MHFNSLQYTINLRFYFPIILLNIAINNSHLQLRLCTMKCVSLYNTRYAKSPAVIGYRYRERVQCSYIYIMSPFFLPEDDDGTTGAGIPSTAVDFFPTECFAWIGR